jgi:hypothetical protein
MQFVGLDDDYVQMMSVVFDCFFPEIYIYTRVIYASTRICTSSDGFETDGTILMCESR